MMRFLAIAIVALGFARGARADGFYFSEAIGGAGYTGGLRPYSGSALRFQIGAGWRHGSPRHPHWAFEFLGGGVDNEGIDPCYEGYERCRVANEGGFNFVGIDVKRRFPLVQSRWTGLGIRAALHAGPRLYWGQGALTGYDGAGFNVGVALEGDIWVLGYFVDFGVDAVWMSMPVDSVVGTSPHVMFGGRFGWL